MVPLLLAVVAFAAPPVAEPAPPQPAWNVPAACPEASSLTDAVTRWIGRPIASDVRRLDVSVVRDDSGDYALTVVFEGTTGTELRQTLRDPDCDVVVEAAALKVAFAIDPEATAIAIETPASTREPAPVPETAPPPEGTEATAPAPAPTPGEVPPRARTPAPTPTPAVPPSRPICAPRPRAGASLRPCADFGVHAGVQVGPLPRVGPGIGGSITVSWARLSVATSVAHWFAAATRRPGTEAEARVRLTAADVAACGRLGVAAVEFPLCGGLQVGALHGRGQGVDDPRDDRLAWIAAIAHAGVVWVIGGRFAPYLRAGLAVPLSAYRFHVNGDDEVHRAARAAFQGALGVAVRVW